MIKGVVSQWNTTLRNRVNFTLAVSSDIPAIMGISPFTTRWQLLLEKAGLAERDFSGNKYTVHGQTMEPKIRDYINNAFPEGEQFEPNRVYDGDIRCHSDGFNGYCVLEIKTTSNTHNRIDDYKIYLVQLLKYMEVNKVTKRATRRIFKALRF